MVVERSISTMTLNMQEIKQRLEEKRDELRTQIGDLTQAHPQPVDTTEISEGPQEFEETATDFLEMQEEQSVLVNEQALLTEVEAALKRIEDGTYGYCVVCGKPIPEKRLEAIPWASLCVEDEAALEKRNLSREELYDADTN